MRLNKHALAFAALSFLYALVMCDYGAFAQSKAAEPPVVQLGTTNPSLPNIRIVGIGGTITNTAVAPNKWQTYAGKRIALKDLIDHMAPAVFATANISTYELPSLGSSSAMSAEVLLKLTSVVNGALRDPNVDAVILTSGTSVMEEVAYWLDLTINSPKPVILTGAMRPSNTLSADGEANLFNSITLAASRKTTCFGSVLLLNDRFYSARDVRKVNAIRLDAFASGESGFLGYIDEHRVRAVNAPARTVNCGKASWNTAFNVAGLTAGDVANVDIVYSYIQASAAPITALIEQGVRGIVLAGHGSGGISVAQAAARDKAIASGVTFVSTTRVGSGPVYSNDQRVLSGDDLLPQKARILLQLALTVSNSTEQAKALFNAYKSPEFDFSSSTK